MTNSACLSPRPAEKVSFMSLLVMKRLSAPFPNHMDFPCARIQSTFSSLMEVIHSLMTQSENDSHSTSAQRDDAFAPAKAFQRNSNIHGICNGTWPAGKMLLSRKPAADAYARQQKDYYNRCILFTTPYQEESAVMPIHLCFQSSNQRTHYDTDTQTSHARSLRPD